VILSSATELLAVRYAEPGEPNTLYYLTGEPRWHGGTIVASEPLDDGPGWHEVDPDTLVRADSTLLRPLSLDLSKLLAP
jgi:gamma-glutamyl hercynylcysteine S-oxide hydrolase